MARSSLRPWLAHLFAVLVAVLGLVAPIARSGVWDPYELDNAELARKIAVHLFGARSLALPNDPPTLPTLTDLGMGELPFTSMALSYKLFGWHDWSGRLPLALWGVVGVLALHVFLTRYVDRRAGAYAAVALVTMPLYYLQARTMIGDVVTLASFGLALFGLVGALVERRWPARLVALGVAAVGLAGGFLSRGMLFGVGAPLVSAGLAGVFAGNLRRFSPLRSAASFLMLAAGIGATVDFFGTALPLVDQVAPLRRSVGMQLFDPTPRESTFDRPIRQIGHALFPWSMLLPFALGRLLRAPEEAAPGAEEREAIARMALLAGAGTALAANAAVVQYAGALPYVGVVALAGAIGVALRDFERGASPSRVVALGTALLGAVLYVDLKRDPVRALAAFTNEGVTFPGSYAEQASTELLLATVVFSGVCALAWSFRDAPAGDRLTLAQGYGRTARWARGRLAQGRAAFRSLGDVWNGNLLFLFVVAEAALVGLAAMLFVGSHAHWASVGNMPRNFVGFGLNAWWAAPTALALGIAGLVAVRDGFDALLSFARSPRAVAVGASGLAVGAWLSFSTYPAVASQLSPKEAFSSFAELHGDGDELGMLGLSPRSASFYFSGPVEPFEEPSLAFPWLFHDRADGTARRWLVLRARDLPRMNALHRARFGKNLPVLDARSSQVLLASDRLGDHPSENPLDEIVTDERPHVDHPVNARLSDQLEVIGWDLVDLSGKHARAAVPGKRYRLRFHYRVLKPIGGNWQAFVHVDGQGRRHNADHSVVDGRYPMSLWRAGDYVRDDCDLGLEPNFLPGDYEIYFGFYNSSGRMKVTEGDESEDRIVGGAIRVL